MFCILPSLFLHNRIQNLLINEMHEVQKQLLEDSCIEINAFYRSAIRITTRGTCYLSIKRNSTISSCFENSSSK